MTGDPFDTDAIKRQILYGVGYRKPPEHTRFKKGQSGNPKGRPRKTPDHAPAPQSNTEIMRRVLAEEVPVRENGRTRKISKAEALERKRTQMALTGQSIHLMRDLRKDLEAEDRRRQAEIDEDHEFWRTYLKVRDHAFKDAARTGRAPEGFWIDPRDITFPEHDIVQIRGPLTQTDVKLFEDARDQANALLACRLFTIKQCRRQTPEERQFVFSGVMLFWLGLVTKLPARMADECHAFRAQIGQCAEAPDFDNLVLTACQRIGLREPVYLSVPRLSQKSFGAVAKLESQLGISSAPSKPKRYRARAS